MTDMMNCVDKLREKKISGYKQRMDVTPYGVYRQSSKFLTFYALSKIWRFTMSFNKGYELKKFEAHWEKLRQSALCQRREPEGNPRVAWSQ